MASYPGPQRGPFHSALTRFRARLTGSQLLDFQQTTYDQLCCDIIRIQHEQENLKAMVNLSRIQSFLEAMENFGKVIEVFLNVSDAVAFMWGPMKFLLLSASNWTESFEIILSAYEDIGEQLPLLSEYESLFHQNPKMAGALELMYIDILDFHQHALQFFSGKVWRKLFKAMWKDFRSKFDGILKSLRRHKELIESRASLFQYNKYREDMQELKAKIDELVLDESDKKKRRVLEWLATESRAQVDHENFLAVRNEYPNTGRWILKHESISNWLTADVPNTPMLWLTGIPGAGKTILASVIIEECRRQKGALTSCFYCSYDDAGNNTALAVFRSLLEQILIQFPLLLAYCYSRCSTSGEPSLRSLTLAKTLLKDFCCTMPKQYIVIDGLDECETVERKQILDFFVSLVGECEGDEPGKLRILFVSQEYPDIKRVLHSSALASIAPSIVKLAPADNQNDIQMYARDLTSNIKSKFDLDSGQEHHLLSLTVERAHGMFLYAKLVLDNLLKQPSREKLIQGICTETFPDGIKQAYERILNRIRDTSSKEEWEQAKKLLGWMVCAKRQLTWREMQVALSLDFDSQEVLYDDRRLRTHIHDICGSLVYLLGDRVQLVHSTARIYIPTSTADIHEPSVECELAAICLQYLTFPCFMDDTEVDKRMVLDGQLGFQDYAMSKWYHHVNAVMDRGKEIIKRRDEGKSPHAREDVNNLLEEMATALDDFRATHGNNWDDKVAEVCVQKCKIFEGEDFYDDLVATTGHIYSFHNKGFEARHEISIKGLAAALERNRDLLEELPSKLNQTELAVYRQFHDDERRFKCKKITCIYFSEGFKDPKARKRHIDMHNRPYQCDVLGCVGAEMGFPNRKDLEKHRRLMHPEAADFSESFKPSAAARAGSQWSCSYCGKFFTRKLHKDDHEKSHRGEKPCVCPECGRAFTRVNDLKRHQKRIHERQ